MPLERVTGVVQYPLAPPSKTTTFPPLEILWSACRERIRFDRKILNGVPNWESRDTTVGLEPRLLPLQQIHWRCDIVHPEILRKRRILPRHGLIHRIRDVAIRNMPRRSRTQFRNIDRLGKIHLEQRSL